MDYIYPSSEVQTRSAPDDLSYRFRRMKAFKQRTMADVAGDVGLLFSFPVLVI